MDKSQREKESLCNWSMNEKERNFKHFAEIDRKLESYFIPKGKSKYLMEYDFETLPELKEMLNELWNDVPHLQNILKIVLVSAMKNKPQEMHRNIKEEKQKHNEQNSHVSDKLPAFIYNF